MEFYKVDLPVHLISHSHTNQSILRHSVIVGEITSFHSVNRIKNPMFCVSLNKGNHLF